MIFHIFGCSYFLRGSRSAAMSHMLRLTTYDMKHSKRRDTSQLPKPLSSVQIRAARALLRWSAEDLAEQSVLSVATIRRAELSEHDTAMTAANDLAIRRVLEAAGV